MELYQSWVIVTYPPNDLLPSGTSVTYFPVSIAVKAGVVPSPTIDIPFMKYVVIRVFKNEITPPILRSKLALEVESKPMIKTFNGIP